MNCERCSRGHKVQEQGNRIQNRSGVKPQPQPKSRFVVIDISICLLCLHKAHTFAPVTCATSTRHTANSAVGGQLGASIHISIFPSPYHTDTLSLKHFTFYILHLTFYISHLDDRPLDRTLWLAVSFFFGLRPPNCHLLRTICHFSFLARLSIQI